MHGILPVFKPKGLTSHDIVSQIRRWSGQKRVGHTGTLDPDVEGVLPICLGQATRVVEYIQEQPKRYVGTLTVGISTSTEDQTGEILEKEEVSSLTESQIKQVFSEFLGEIEQIPPMYSAVKIDGQRLYKLARKGQVVERKPRKAMIYALKTVMIKQGRFPTIDFDVTCSKGTYIRTLCVDIGMALGFPAHMSSLMRMESGPFHLSDCYHMKQLMQIETTSEKKSCLYAIDEGLGHLPSLFVDDADVPQVLNGLSLQLNNTDQFTPLIRVYSESRQFCGLYRIVGDIAKPEKVFRDVN